MGTLAFRPRYYFESLDFELKSVRMTLRNKFISWLITRAKVASVSVLANVIYLKQ